MRSSERKESLERSARLRLQEMNAALRSQVDLLTSQLALSRTMSASGSMASSLNSGEAGGTDWQAQIARRDTLIAQLVSQSRCHSLKIQNSSAPIEECCQLVSHHRLIITHSTFS